jgi:DNA-binding transcriptional MerR regulator/methylmalonyl-CoA mutase cobalamin-binding subunit
MIAPVGHTAPDSMGETFPIRTVAGLTGVNPITLRAWEHRYGVIQPLRTAKGHRLYTRDHIALIQRVQAMLERGMNISQASQALAAKNTGAGGPWRTWQKRMIDAISRFDESGLEDVYNDALAVHSFEQANRGLLMPLLEELGRRWQAREGSVAEEHFFGVYLRNKLGAQFHHRPRNNTGPRLLCACPEGEHHVVGLLLFALAAEAAGFRCVLLGANMPLAEIPVAAHHASCAAVVLSSSVELLDRTLQTELSALLRTVGIPVFIGGTTSLRHRDAISATGAIALGSDIPLGVRRIAEALSGDHSR